MTLVSGVGRGEVYRAAATLGRGRQFFLWSRGEVGLSLLPWGQQTECLGRARVLAGVHEGGLSLKRKPRGAGRPGGCAADRPGLPSGSNASVRQLHSPGPFPGGAGWTPAPGPVWLRGPGGGLRRAGEAVAEVAGRVLARRARAPPVGVAELKCIGPPGRRGAQGPGILSLAVVCTPLSPLPPTRVACAFRDG